jgi:hypothetical protein
VAGQWAGKAQGLALLISPLEGEMSPQATEGVASREALTFIGRKEVASNRTDPLWPAGHLPRKGGDQLLTDRSASTR